MRSRKSRGKGAKPGKPDNRKAGFLDSPLALLFSLNFIPLKKL